MPTCSIVLAVALAVAPAELPRPQKPSQLLTSLASVSAETRLAGAAISLVDALRGAKTRGEQTRRVEAYWNLSAAVVNYHLAVREAMELNTLRAGVARPGPQWQQSETQNENRLQIARRAAIVAQHRLQQLLDQSAESILPLPTDLPHCGPYDSRYDEIFERRRDPAAQLLHELLPLELQQVRTEGQAVATADAHLQWVSRHRGPETDGSDLLRAYEQLQLHRRAFVDAVRTYNQTIARYTEQALPDPIDTQRLVAMLIHVDPNQFNPNQQQADRDRSHIQRTSAHEQLDNQPAGVPRKTFVVDTPSENTRFDNGRWGPPPRTPTNRNRGEHSILVNPKLR